MTLAVILLLNILWVALASPAALSGHQSTQAAPADKQANSADAHDQSGTPATQNPSTAPSSSTTAPPQASPGQNRPPARKHLRRKKKVVPSNCNSAPAAGSSSASGTTASGSAPTGAAGNAGTSSAPENCPPSKTVVRQGGTSEPSIQLAGSANGDQTANQRDTANQLLGSTQENLKKITGRQLSPNQQDMVTQIHQFMEQSKSAVAAGDLDRARTFAWKAQVLSEELVKPNE